MTGKTLDSAPIQSGRIQHCGEVDGGGTVYAHGSSQWPGDDRIGGRPAIVAAGPFPNGNDDEITNISATCDVRH